MFLPNRAILQTAMDDFNNQAYTIHATTPFTGKLDFKTLAVLPGLQRKGLGEKLVEYSGFRADKENIPIFFDATAKGFRLYVRKGGSEIGKIVQEEQIVESREGGQPIKLDRLETPVLRWDSCQLPPEVLKVLRASKF